MGRTQVFDYESILSRCVVECIGDIHSEVVKDCFGDVGMKNDEDGKRKFIKEVIPLQGKIVQRVMSRYTREDLIVAGSIQGKSSEEIFQEVRRLEMDAGSGGSQPANPTENRPHVDPNLNSVNKKAVAKEVLQLVQRLGLNDACNIFSVVLDKPPKFGAPGRSSVGPRNSRGRGKGKGNRSSLSSNSRQLLTPKQDPSEMTSEFRTNYQGEEEYTNTMGMSMREGGEYDSATNRGDMGSSYQGINGGEEIMGNGGVNGGSMGMGSRGTGNGYLG